MLRIYPKRLGSGTLKIIKPFFGKLDQIKEAKAPKQG
jgi:hypothetical protein